MLGVEVYDIAHEPLDLGLLGLAEAIPGVTLVLYGGHVADRHDRRWLMMAAALVLAAVAGALSLTGALAPGALRVALFAGAFLAGVARAFRGPASSGLEAQVVPADRVIPGVALLATTGRVADVLGPVAGGLAIDALSGGGTYLVTAALFLASALSLVLAHGSLEDRRREATSALPPTPGEEGAGRRILEGIRYVFGSQVLVGSMALDLFAVFFGGATALLPAIATDILHVGPTGLGLLRGAMGAGSLAAAIFASRLLPLAHAGRALHVVIAGFGVSMIVFGLSHSLPLSLACLFIAGVCDGASVIVRRAILRFASPEHMRGRISAVKSVFVGSSNELGALESGLAATWLGLAAAIWTGGAVTLAVVAATALLAPELRRLDLEAMARRGAGAPPLEDATVADLSDPPRGRRGEEARQPDFSRATVGD